MTFPDPAGRAGTHQPVLVSSRTDSRPKKAEKSWPARSTISPYETPLPLTERARVDVAEGLVGESEPHGFQHGLYSVWPTARHWPAGRLGSRYTLILMGAPGTIAG